MTTIQMSRVTRGFLFQYHNVDVPVPCRRPGEEEEDSECMYHLHFDACCVLVGNNMTMRPPLDTHAFESWVFEWLWNALLEGEW